MTAVLLKRSRLFHPRILFSTVSYICLTLALTSASGIASADAANYNASNEAELVNAINQANASGDANSTITLTGDFVILSPLPTAMQNITIDATGHTLTTYSNPAISAASGANITILGKTLGTGAASSDSGRLAKAGDGTMTLDEVNGTYASAISVDAGTLAIGNGSQILAGNSYGGSVNVGNGGTLIISGAGTQVTSRAGVALIQSATGSTVTVEKGAIFDQTVNNTQLGNVAGTKGTLNVDGAGSLYKAQNITTQVGQSTIHVSNGGRITSAVNNIGGLSTLNTAGTSTITVSGTGSSWVSSGMFNFFNGTMSVLDGGLVSTTNMRIAQTANKDNASLSASVLVSGDTSELAATGASGIEIGAGGNGTLTVANGGKITAQGGSGTIKIAANAAGTGTLNIGGAAGQAATKAGTIDAASIQFGAGKGTLNFNHTESDYDFDVALTGNGAINQIGSGKTTFSTDQSKFTGVTNVEAGTLAVNDKLGGSANVHGGTLAVNGTLDGPASVSGGLLAVNGTVTGNVELTGGRLQGIGTVGSTIHGKDGIIAPGNSIGTLTIDGNYTGQGGLLEIETVLGDDNSATDKLVITGDTAGDTDVTVSNLNGNGAPTVQGIKIIEVGGNSDGNFALKGNYQKEGVEYVIAGAYAYGLYKGSPSSQDGNWYLRSTVTPQEPNNSGGTPGNGNGNTGGGSIPGNGGNAGNEEAPKPRYQPGTPVYEAYAQNLLAANGLPTLQQRVGNRYWGASAAENNETPTTPAAIWGRVEGAHGKFEPKTSASLDNYDTDVWKMQAGLDGQFIENESGKLIGGLTFQYANVSTDASSTLFGDGSINTDGYGFGGTLTWYGNDGFYVDGQAQATWYRSDLFSDTANTGLAGDNDGFGYAFSVETGKRFATSGNWTLTPQAQLVYSAIDFDSFNGIIGTSSTHVSLDRGSSLQGRLGLSADYETSWTGTDGKIVRAHSYAIANLYQEFLGGTRVIVGDTGLTTENDRTWGGIGTGGSYDWANGKYILYGEMTVNTSLRNFANSYTLNGTAGFKVSF